MHENILIGISALFVIGISAQWLAWRFRLPAILLLLILGFVVGPLTGLIKPVELFGELLLPIVSLSVAVILYEGGLSLRFSDIRELRGAVLRLVSLGVLITWGAVSLCAFYILGLERDIALLLGAVLVVTGPTVIIPLLRHVRPRGKVGSVMKWEGIINDPIGALIAVLVFEAILASGGEEAALVVLMGISKAAVTATIAGLLGSGILILLLKRYWVPDFLQNPVSLVIMLASFTLSNAVQTESGLLAVTLMGIVLANQKWVDVKHIVDFKETLRVLIISGLFILLAARLTTAELTSFINAQGLLFLLLLILIVRPLAVWFSTIKSSLGWKDRLLLAWMAPRGIVAAAVSSVFALRLMEQGFQGSETLVSVTFLVITGTVAVYSLTALPLARWLGLADENPQGALIIGANKFARALAVSLHENGFKTLVIDTNWRNVVLARKEGIQALYENALSQRLTEDLELDGIGKLLALTPNDQINSLACMHFSEFFNRSDLFQLNPPKEGIEIPKHLRSRPLFDEKVSFSTLEKLFDRGAKIKTTNITERFTFDDFKSVYGESAVPLFIITAKNDLSVIPADGPPSVSPGQKLIFLLKEESAIK